MKIQNIKKLNITCSQTNIILIQTDDDNFEVSIDSSTNSESKKIMHIYENDVLNISTKFQQNYVTGFNFKTIFNVTIKGNFNNLDQLTIGSNIGELLIKNTQLKNFKLESNISKIKIHNCNLLNNTFELNGSKLNIYDSTLNKTKIESNVGKIRAYNSLIKDFVKIEANVSSIYLNILNLDEVKQKKLFNIKKIMTHFKIVK